MQVVLEVVEGPHSGQSFRFAEHDNFIVGRARCAHFRLPKKDPYFSRVHFMIEVNPPYCYLMDMGSTNGTRVNGERTQAAYLGDGDLIQGGDTVLRVSLVGKPGETADASSRRPPPLPDEPKTPLGAGPRPVAPSAPPPEMPVPAPPSPPAAEPRPAVPPNAASPPNSAPPSHPPAAEPPAARGRPAPEDPRLQSTGSFHGAPPEVPIRPPEAAPVPAEERSAIPGYEIEGMLGSGGMGVVYLGRRTSDRMQVAIKTIALATSAPRRETQRFLREANILRQLRHPNIVAFHQMDRAADVLYFVMDYVPGIDAATLQRCEAPLAIGRAVRLICQALEGLHYAHLQGFVHRDVKPANLLVSQSQGRDVCQVADFGLARAYQASAMSGITILGETGGTVPYMPPEQITHYRDASPASDQYSAAASLYRLLTGQHLFDFGKLPPHERLKKVLFDDPAPIRRHRRDVPEPLAQTIHRALLKEPTARFPNAAAFRDALVSFAGDA